MNKKEIKNLLIESQDEIVKAIWAISNPIRFRILTFLIDKNFTFKELIFRTFIKKTALSNHLNILIKNNLIEKEKYGVYKITQKGVIYLEYLAKLNLETKDLKESIEEIKKRKNFRNLFYKK